MAAIAWGWLLSGGITGGALVGLLVSLLLARRHAHTVAALQAQLQSAEVACAVLQTRLAAEQHNAAERLAVLSDARGQLTAQFQQLAADILEDKSRRFSEQNQLALGNLLSPVRERLQAFQNKVEEVHLSDTRERSALGEQLRQLQALNQALSSDAKNLTQALRGSSKTQGVWGELVLERILEASGLRRGIEFDVQPSFQREDNSRAQPDLIVRLPDDRHLVIDAKVSLTAFAEYMSADDDERRQSALARHRSSVRQHIRGLSERDYPALLGGRAQDFVLMFVPIEPAFLLAIAEDESLFADSWQRNVLLVSPSTLLFALRTVAHLWRQEAQSRNAQAIASRGAQLYDKLVAFVEDLEKIGDRLQQAQNSFSEARAKLSSQRGNVIRQAELLRELGVQPTKSMPPAVLELATQEALQPALVMRPSTPVPLPEPVSSAALVTSKTATGPADGI